MTVTDFLLPVFVQVFLTFALLLRTAMGRIASFRSGEVKPQDIALGEPGWPKKITQYGNAFKNQLELPVLFYVLIAFILTTRVGDALLLDDTDLDLAMREADVAIRMHPPKQPDLVQRHLMEIH